jgi:hypothetical protein
MALMASTLPPWVQLQQHELCARMQSVSAEHWLERAGTSRTLLLAASATLFLLGLLSKEVLLLALPAFVLFPTEAERADTTPPPRERALAAAPLVLAAAHAVSSGR